MMEMPSIPLLVRGARKVLFRCMHFGDIYV